MKTDKLGWEKFMVGMGRGDVGPFTQKNRVEGDFSVREYTHRGKVIARLSTKDFRGKLQPHESLQIFEVAKSLTKKVEYIYIPTDEDYEKWEEEDFETNENITQMRIAEKEGREYIPPRRK